MEVHWRCITMKRYLEDKDLLMKECDKMMIMEYCVKVEIKKGDKKGYYPYLKLKEIEPNIYGWVEIGEKEYNKEGHCWSSCGTKCWDDTEMGRRVKQTWNAMVDCWNKSK
jgi:hypothetical protein